MLRARNGSADEKLLGVREALTDDRWQIRRGVDGLFRCVIANSTLT